MNVKTIVTNKYFINVACVLVGIGIGILFYPNSTLIKTHDEQITSVFKEEITKKSQYVQKLEELLILEKREVNIAHDFYKNELEILKKENKQLKASSKKTTYKLIKPDGTIVETTSEESNLEQISSIVEQNKQSHERELQQQKETIEKSYSEKLSKTEHQSKETIDKYAKENKEISNKLEQEKNKKQFGIEAGILLTKDWYTHITYDLYGPFFIGGQIQFNMIDPSTVGVGIGIKF
jgi:hypothetical protein